MWTEKKSCDMVANEAPREMLKWNSSKAEERNGGCGGGGWKRPQREPATLSLKEKRERQHMELDGGPGPENTCFTGHRCVY